MKKIVCLFSILLFMGTMAANAQTRMITGTVTSAEDGAPIPGVSITVRGTTLGTVTNMDGNYSLQVPEDALNLIFSFVGMATQEIAIAGRSTINIVMQPQIIGVVEVVVTAMGIQRDKKALGYSVQTVDEEDLVLTGNTSLMGAMQGKLAGVDIKPSSGMPGASAQMVIRGARSFTGNNTPLYVVDGMPVASTGPSTGNSVTGPDYSNRSIDINPADIESIEILKGQAASALYGIRASNGVVLITTKSGRSNAIGKPVVSITHHSTFDAVSRTPDYQTTWAQGSYGVYTPTASFSWGPKIVDLPKDPARGGNTDNTFTKRDGKQEGKYYVPQLELAGLNPWLTPQVYNNWTDYYETGYTNSNNVNVSQATQEGNYSMGIGYTDQSGIALSSGMSRYNAKAVLDRNLNKNFKVGFSGNWIRTEIDKLSGANDGSLTGILAAPSSYNLKGTPYHKPGDPYSQIYFRSLTFDNPYWVPENNKFTERAERFFGNAYVEFHSPLSDGMNLKIRFQPGIGGYTNHFQDIFGFGSKGGKGNITNHGITGQGFNSLFTVNYDWTINDDLEFSALLGHEYENGKVKEVSGSGSDFNFGGWNHIGNANVVTAAESQEKDRVVGTFGSLSLAWKSMLFLNATGRNDIVSMMPRDNRTFFYPSVSLGFVVSELAAVKNIPSISFAKLRASYAEVGQAGRYYENYYVTPGYGGGFWTGGDPIQYPVGGINSYIPNATQYDPNLKPQNTQSYELGIDLKLFNNRFGVDYTYSRQEVTDQIFPVPLAGSTGATQLVMNGGAVQTDAHEVMLYVTPVKTRDFQWDINLNFAKVTNNVLELAEGVESIFLGGFVTPQVRAGIGNTYPVIYGVSFVKDDDGNIVVNDSPGAWNHGMPQIGEPDVIGEVSPDFILGGSNTFTYKTVSLTTVFEWKNGGEMYSGSNGLLDLYGMSAVTEDRASTFIYKGVKPDGTPNDIVRGGPNDPNAIQDLYTNVLSNVDEYYIHENSFVKLREVALQYKFPRPLYKTLNVGVSLYSRNILLWTALRNLDPEMSQGNNNMGGSFERFTLPQTTSFGFGFDITF